MDFYNPTAQKSGAINAGAISSAPSQSAPRYMLNQANDLKRGKVGYLDTEQLGQDQWGTGASFQGAARPAMIDALKSSFSNANPEDYAAMDEARDLFRRQLGDVPTLENMGQTNLDTTMQRGLSNLLQQHANAAAGTGRLGSRQYAGAAGDITARVAGEYNKGLLDLRNAGINQGLALSGGLGQLQARNLAERQFQLQQGQSLSSLIERMAAADQGRQAQLSAAQAAEDAANKQMWGQIISSGLSAGGMALAGPPGAIAGGAVGRSAVGAPASPSGYSVGGASGMYDPSRWNNGYYGG